MALMTPLKPMYVSDKYRLYPARYYSRPAMAPGAVGGRAGYSQRNLTSQYKYTLEQMAVSPYSVNDRNYMERIRKHYGIADSNQYQLYGNIGGFLGAGVGAAFSLGFLNKPSAWVSQGVFSAYNPRILANRNARSVAFAPKNDPMKHINAKTFSALKHATVIKTYNDTITALTKAKGTFDVASEALQNAKSIEAAAESALKTAQKAYPEAVKGIQKGQTVILDSISTYQKALDTAKEATKAAATTYNSALDIYKSAYNGAETAYKTLQSADKAFDAVKMGSKVPVKVGGFVPIVGIGLDAVSLGLSASAFVDSLKAGDIKGSWINGIATFLDAVALGADFIPGPGDILSVGASVASGTLTGWYSGQTIGHSLSPSGLRAQANFFNNLSASVQARPISTVGTLLTLGAVSKMAGIGRSRNSKWSQFWIGSGWGNFARSTVSMGAMRLVNAGTSWLEDQIGLSPEDPSQVNFTNGIGIWGDINDNLFGATLRKTQLTTLLNKDNDITFSELYEKSWGITDKKDEIYYSIMFSDVREAAGIDAKQTPIINSFIDILGEVFVDPQNYVESYQRAVQVKLTDNTVDFFDAAFSRAEEIVRLKQAFLKDQNPDAKLVIDKAVVEEFLVGPDGILRGDRQTRKRFLKQAVQAYATEGEKGLRAVIADITTTKYQGKYGNNVNIIRGEAEANVEILVKLFDDVLRKGNYRSLRYTNPVEINGYRTQLEAMKEITDNIAKNVALSDTQQKLKDEAVATINRLRNFYGPDSEKVLVEKFMADVRKDLTPRHLRALYAVDQDVRFHTDVVDEYSSLSTWTFMPVQKIFGSATTRKVFKALANFSRRTFAAKAQSAKTILETIEVFGDVDKNFKQDDVHKILKEREDEFKAQPTLEDIIKPKDPDRLVVEEQAAELSASTSKHEADYLRVKATIEEHRKVLEEDKKQLEKDQKYTFVPTKATYGGKNDYVSIKDVEDAKAKLREAIAYEEREITSKGMTISQFARRNKDLLSYQRYEALKIAASDYLLHTRYKTVFDAVTKYTNYGISLVSHLTDLLYRGERDLWGAIGYFRAFYNRTVKMTRYDYTKNMMATLTKRLDKIKAEISEQEVLAEKTRAALDKLDTELKEIKAKLSGQSTEGEATKELLTERFDTAKKERDLALTKATSAQKELEEMRSELKATESKLAAYQADINKMETYRIAKQKVADEKRAWTSADFNKETMMYSEVETSVENNRMLSGVEFDPNTWATDAVAISKMQSILARSGVEVYYEDADGKRHKVIIGTKLMEPPYGASLQVSFEVSLEDAFYGTLIELLTSRSSSVILADTFESLKTLNGDELTPELWRKLGPAKQAEIVVEMLQRLNLTDAEKQDLTPTTIRMLVKNLNDVALKGNKKVIQIEKLDNPEDIRALVVSRIKNHKDFAEKYTDLVNGLKSMSQRFEKLQQRIELSDATPEEKFEQQILASYVLDNFNKSFKHTVGYKYIRSYIMKSQDKRTHLDLFLDKDNLEGEELPKFHSLKYLKDKPETKIHTLEQALIDYVESEVVQEVIKFSQESIEYAKNQSLLKKQEELSVVVEKRKKELDQAIEAKEAPEKIATLQDKLKISSDALEELSDKVQEVYDSMLTYAAKYSTRNAERDAQEIKDGVVLKKVTDKVDSIIGDKDLKNVTGVKILNRHTKTDDVNARNMSESFGKAEYYRDHSEVHILLTPTKFFASMSSKQAKEYYKILTEYNRRSPEHTRVLRAFAEYLYFKVTESKGALKVVNLPPAMRINGIKLDAKESFIQQVITAYKEKDGIEVVAVNKSSKVAYNSTRFLRLAVRKALKKYVEEYKDNKDINALLEPYLSDAGNINDENLEKFSARLGALKSEDTSDEGMLLKKIRAAVWADATQWFEEIKVRNSQILGEVLKRADRLHNFERTDIKSLSEGHYTVSYDVFTKLAYRNPKMETLLKNIINYELDGSPEDTPLFAIIKLLDKAISEDYKDKEVFVPSDYTGVKIEDGVAYFETKRGHVSLFNLLYIQHVNIVHVRNLLNTFKYITEELRNEFEQAYMKLVNENKGLLSYQPGNITKEIYLSTEGNTLEEWEFLENNAGVASIYNMLALDTSLKKLGPDLKDPVRLKHYLNQDVREIFRESLDTDKALKTLQNRKVKVSKETLNTRELKATLFGMLVLTSDKLSKETKKYIVSDLMFYKADPIRAGYTEHVIEKANTNLKKLRAELAKGHTTTRTTIENQILINENLIRHAEDINSKLKYADWKDSDKRFEMLLKNPELLNKVYSFYYDTDGSDGTYVMARLYNEDRTAYEYVPVKKQTKSGTLNVQIISKGVPAFNLAVISGLKNPANTKLKTAVLNKINESVLWQSYIRDGAIKEIHISEEGSILLVTANIKDATGEFDNTNTKLHDRIAEARSSLIKEIGDVGSTKFYDLYTMSEKQYKSLLDGKLPEDIKKEDVDTEAIYEVILDKNGNVVGEQAPVVNTSAVKSVVPALFMDISRWDDLMSNKGLTKITPMNRDKAYTEGELLDALIKYALLHDTKILPNQAFFSKTTLSSSETLRRLKRNAESLQAYYDFVNFLEAEGIAIDDINLQRLSDAVFQRRFIHKNLEGAAYDINNLSKDLDKKLYDELIERKYKEESYYTKVQNVLTKMQERYGDANIDTDSMRTMPEEFVDTLDKLMKTAVHVVSNAGQYGKALQYQISNILNKHYDDDLPYGADVDQLRNSNMLSERFLTVSGVRPTIARSGTPEYTSTDNKTNIEAYEKSGINNPAKDGRVPFKKALEKIRVAFKEHGQEELEIAEALYERHSSKRKHERALLKQEKYSRLNYQMYKQLLNQLDSYEFSLGDLDPVVDYKDLAAISNTAKILGPQMIALIDKHDGKSLKDYDDPKYTAEYNEVVFLLKLFRQSSDTVIKKSTFKTDQFKTVNGTSRFLVNVIVWDYMKNLVSVMPRSEAEIARDLLFATNVDVDTLNKYMQEQIKANKKAYKEAQKASLAFRTRKGANDAVVGIDEFYTETLNKRLGESNVPSDLNEAFVSILDRVQQRLYPSTKDEVLKSEKVSKVVLQDLINEYHRENKISRSTAAILEDVLKEEGEVARGLIQFVVVPFLFKKQIDSSKLSKEVQEALVKGVDYDEEFLKEIKKSRKKVADKPVEFSSADVWKYRSLPILQQDRKFFEYLLNRYFSAGGVDTQIDDVLASIGIKDSLTIKSIKRSKHLEEVYYLIKDTLKPQDMFVFVEVVNVAKRKYLTEEHNKRHGESGKFSWLAAYLDHGRLKVRAAQRDIKDLVQMGSFDGVYDSNIIKAMRDETAFLFDALSFVQRTNATLQHIMIPVNERQFEKNTLDDTPVRQVEAQYTTQARIAQREMLSVFFKKISTASPQSQQYFEIQRGLNVAPIDMMAEYHAESWDTVGNVSTAYNGLRKTFNSIMYALYGGKIAKRNFISNSEAAAILKILEETKQTVLWANLFNVLEERAKNNSDTSKYNQKELEEGFKDAEKFFKEHESSMHHLDEMTIKAIVAFALNSRMSKDDPLRLTKRNLLTFSKEQAEAKHRQFMRRLQYLSYRLNASTSKEDVAEIIFGKSYAEIMADQSESAKETQRLFEIAERVKKLLQSGYQLTPTDLYDMYVESLPADVELRSAETGEVIIFRNAESTYQMHSRQLKGYTTHYNNTAQKALDQGKTFEEVLADSLQSAVADYENAKHHYESLESQIDDALEEVNKERLNIYKEILSAHPELLSQYLLAQAAKHKKKVVERQTKLTALNKHIPDKVVQLLNERVARLEEIRKLFASKRQQLLKETKEMSQDEIVAHIEANYKWALDEDKLTPLELLQASKLQNKALNEEKKKLNEALTDESGTVLFSEKQVVKYITKLFKEKLTDEDFRSLQEFEVTAEDVLADNKEIEKIVGTFFKDVRAWYLETSRSEFKELLKNNKVGSYDEATKIKLKEILNERIAAISKRLEKLESELSAVKPFAAYSTWYAGQTSYKEKQIKELQETLKQLQNNLKGLDDTATYSFKELLDKSLKQYLFKKNLTFENSVEDILDFLTGGSGTYTKINELKEQRKEFKTVVEKREDAKKHAEKQMTIKEDYAKEQAKNVQLKESRDSAEAKMLEAAAYRNTEHPFNNTNLGTYKNLRKDKYAIPTSLEEQAAQEAQVIEDVVQELATKTNLSLSEIEQHIKDMGDRNIHNSFIDAAITLLNYMQKYNKTKDDEFYVFDMETIRHNGEEVPYQMTWIHNKKGTTTVANQYFNSIAFNRETSEDTETITEFKNRMYETKRDMYITSRTLNNEPQYKPSESEEKMLRKDADAEVEKLIKQIKYVQNHSAFLSSFVLMFEDIKQNRIPLVTHNGKRFDLPNFETFVSRYANTLLSNFYYSNIYRNNPDKIIERFNDRKVTTYADLDNLGDSELSDHVLEALQKEHVKILEKLQDSSKRYTVTFVELEQLDKLNDAIYRAEIARHVKGLEERFGIRINPEVREALFDPQTGQVVKLRNKVATWLAATPEERLKIRNELVAYYVKGMELSAHKDPEQYTPDIEDKVDALLKEYARLYDEHRNNNVSITFTEETFRGRRKQVIDTVLEATRMKTKDTKPTLAPYDVQAYIEAQENQIRQLEEVQNLLESGNYDVVDKSLAEYDKERGVLEERLVSLEEQVMYLEAHIDNYNLDAKGYLAGMSSFLTNLQRHYTQQLRQALEIQTHENILLSDDRRNNTMSITNDIGYKYQLEEVLKDIQRHVVKLTNVLEVLSKEYIALEESPEFIKLQGSDEYQIKLNEAFSKRISTLGFFKEEWYDFKTEKELTEHKRALDKEIKNYEELAEDFRFNKYEDLKNKKYFDERLEEFKASEKANLNKHIVTALNIVDSYLPKLNGIIKTPTFEIDKLTGDIKAVKEYLKTFLLEVKEFLKASGVTEVDLRTDGLAQRLLSLINPEQGSIIKSVELVSILDTDVEKTYEEVHRVIEQGLRKSIANLKELRKGLDKVQLGASIPNSLLAANEQIKQLLNRIGQGKDFIADMTDINILNIVTAKGKTSKELLRAGEFEKVASSKKSKTDIEALGEDFKWVTRLYDDAIKNDPKKALMYKTDRAYYRVITKTDGSKMFIIGFHDQLNEHTQTIIIDSSLNPKLELTYNYRYAHKPLNPPTQIKLSKQGLVTEDLGYGETSYSKLNVEDEINNFYAKYVPSISSANVYKLDDTDASFESIKRTYEFYGKYLSKLSRESVYGDKKDLTPEQQGALLEKAVTDIMTKAKAINVNELHLRDIDIIDMTSRVENMFIQYVKTARALAGERSFRDAVGVYRGLADRLLSRFNSRVPGKLLNLLDPEFTTTQLIQYDDESLYEKNIDIINTPEGGMGSTFAERTPYTLDLPFTHNTNGIRVMLPNPKLQGKFTAIGIHNILYVLEDTYPEIKNTDKYRNNTSLLFDKLEPQTIKTPKGPVKDYVVFLKNKTLSTVSKSAPEDRLMTFNEGVLNTLKSIGFGTGHNILTPDVLTRKDYKAYADDVAHKLGLNLKVTFANDARTFEDVVLMDYDIAMAIGWDKGYKTWIGRAYGFKGAAKLVHGLYAEYGSAVVANADSVGKRGSYGALEDMAIHNIGTAIKNRKTLSADELSKYKHFLDSYDKPDGVIHKYLEITDDGKFLVYSNTDYAKFFAEEELFGDLTSKDIQTKIDSVIRVSLDGVKDYKVRRGNDVVKVSSAGQYGWQGSLYVMLDSEHITEHMANKAELQDFGGIAVARVDESGTVLSGVVHSISVLYPMLAKSSGDDMNWLKAFYNEDDPQTVIRNNKKVQLYTRIAYKGINALIDEYGIRDPFDNIDVAETIAHMQNQHVNQNMINYTNEYFTYQFWSDEAVRLGNASLGDYAKLRMAELNKKTRQEAHDKFVGKHGVLNSALFKKHVGGRQQVLANTEFRLGCIATNAAIWKNNARHSPNWVQYESYSEKELLEDVLDYDYDNGTNYVDRWNKVVDAEGNHTGYELTVDNDAAKYIEVRLNTLGLMSKSSSGGTVKHDIVSKSMNDTETTFVINKVALTEGQPATFIRAYGWMLSMRSPVQDYNGVPLMKVTGFHDHQALEANQYLYKMIGGDNDGDTLGMIAIDSEQYQYLKALDATKVAYYDEGYFDSVERDYTIKTDSGYRTKDIKKIKSISINAAHVGKHTYSSYEVSPGVFEKIRTEQTHDEMYLGAFKNVDLTSKEIKDVLYKLYPTAFEDVTKNEQLMRTYVNVLIRYRTGGLDSFEAGRVSEKSLKDFERPFYTTKGYANKEAMLKYLTANQEIVALRYALNSAVTDSKKEILNFIKLTEKDIYSMWHTIETVDQEYLQDTYQLFENDKPTANTQKLKRFLASENARDLKIREEVIVRKIISYSTQVSVTRTHGSKIGIEAMGGNRKIEFISSLVLRLSGINRDATGDLLESLGAYTTDKDTGVTAITPVSLASAIFGGSAFDVMLLDMQANKYELPKTPGDFYKSLKKKKTFKKVYINKKDEKVPAHKSKYRSAEDVSLVEAFRLIDPTMTTEDATKYAEEMWRETSNMLYDAYQSKLRVAKVFNSLAKGLSSHSLQEGLRDFFTECYSTEKEIATLYPMVDMFRQSLLASSNYEPDEWEIQWLKIQLFGAQQKEADRFFRLTKVRSKEGLETLKETIESYGMGYLNEHIIGRRELGILSDKASAIIGLAKHYGSDIRTSVWLNAYLNGLIEEVSKHNIRLTNLDPKRQFLSLAIAMDRNPFETFEENLVIKDADYNEALAKKERTSRERITLKKRYTNTEDGAQTLKELTEDNFSVQLLGNLDAHPLIVEQVKKSLLEFLSSFDDARYDISTDAGFKAAALAAEKAATVLISYGISGRRIRNFVDDYMANLLEINQTLVQQNKAPISHTQKDKTIKNALRFMEIMYKISTRVNREKYASLLREHAPKTNAIIQDELVVDTYYYTYDENNRMIKRTDNNELDIKSHTKDSTHEELSAIGAKGEYVFEKIKTSPQAEQIVKMFLDRAKLNLTDKYDSLEQIEKSLLDQYYALRGMYVNVDKQREALKNKPRGTIKTPDEIRFEALQDQLHRTSIIEDDINNLAISKNDYILTVQKKKKLESNIREIQKRKEYINALLEKIAVRRDSIQGLTSVEEQIKEIKNLIEEHRKKIDKATQQISDTAFNKTFSELTPLIHTEDDNEYTIRNMYTYSAPKYVTDKDIDSMRDNSLMQLHRQMSPFLLTSAVFMKDDGNGKKSFDSDAMYKWLVSRYDHTRLYLIREGDDDEGLLKRLFNTVYKVVEVEKGNKLVNAVKKAAGKTIETKKKTVRAFKNAKELAKYIKEVSDDSTKQMEVKFNKQTFEGIDTKITQDAQLTPTLKEINIKGPKDLEYIYEQLQDPVNGQAYKSLIGFVNMNDAMDAYELAYIPFKHTDWGAGFLQKMYSLSKMLQRLSAGFLIRNWLDTWNQLYSELQQRYGVIGTLFKTGEIIRIMKDTSEIKSVYHRVSLDRTLYLTAFNAEYKEIQNILASKAILKPGEHDTVVTHLENIVRVIESYHSAKLTDGDTLSNSISNKQAKMSGLVKDLKGILTEAASDVDVLRNHKAVSTIERAMSVVNSMKFAEYFILYDKLADVFNEGYGDTLELYKSHNTKYIDRLRKQYDGHWSTFKQDLFEISAFMQTNAQLDMYQRDQGEIIKNVLEDMLHPDKDPIQDYSILRDAIDKELSNETTTFLKAFGRSASALVSRNPLIQMRAAYDWLTADTENTGRMAGYMLDKYLHNLTFEQSVDKSLTRFFNYGQRAPIETNMLADVPYLSFPIRSVNNWINRLTDPRYLRLLSDALDGIYGQYADEDGQYDEYTRYQMANGWIPVAGGVGIRAGNGAFDVLQLLTDPSEQFSQRKSPIGRMIVSIGDYLVSKERDEEKLLSDVLRQSAMVGFATRGVNQITALNPDTRSTLANTPVARGMVQTRSSSSKTKDLARALSPTYVYDHAYEKYSPNKYKYSQGNGRYKYYENIYKDWFNKYGRMRVPKVDPYSLVKDIQWKQYVRSRRTN